MTVVLAIVFAIMTTANVVWAITEAVRSPVAAFAGFVCGVSWMAVYVIYAVQP